MATTILLCDSFSFEIQINCLSTNQINTHEQSSSRATRMMLVIMMKNQSMLIYQAISVHRHESLKIENCRKGKDTHVGFFAAFKSAEFTQVHSTLDTLTF